MNRESPGHAARAPQAATLQVAALLLIWAAACPSRAQAEVVPSPVAKDSRIRVATYDSDQVYRLYGVIGYQIDLEFETGEAFVGLGAGDIEGVSFFGQDNHLFLKPKAAKVATNMTILTNRRRYQIDYSASADRDILGSRDVIYAVRFVYPVLPGERAAADAAQRIDTALGGASAARRRNEDYWYCGDPTLMPTAASDDGVHTRVRFAANKELPAVFVRNADGSESLLNFSMDEGDVVIHRVARQFILRRGKLTGCIVNRGYSGSGLRLDSGTVTPEVERDVPGRRP
jgi:type IV secretion system protein VirB9